MPNFRSAENGGTITGELISFQSDHRAPSTKPLANLVGKGRSLFLKKSSLFLLSFVTLLFLHAGSAFAATPLSETTDALLGVKYKYGGTTINGFDCSGFTSYVFKQFEIELNRSSRDQAKEGVKVDKSELRPGDLVFFNTGGSGISHAGIYLGDDVFVHAASGRTAKVVKNKLSEAYYVNTYVTARRVLDDEAYAKLTADIEDAASATEADPEVEADPIWK